MWEGAICLPSLKTSEADESWQPHKRSGGMPTEEQEKPFERVVLMIRESSKEGRLVSTKEILQGFKNQGLWGEGKEITESDLQAFLSGKMEENNDLKEIPDQEGHPRYYSSLLMSESYAKILIRKEGDPLLLITNTVRESSATSSRPIPISLFLGPPFMLSQEEIDTCLQRMREGNQYQDIRQTTTSIGTQFLYSTLSLAPDHAPMLAEWLDVGQANNP